MSKSELKFKIHGDGRSPVEMAGLPALRLPMPYRFPAPGTERKIDFGVSFSCPVLVYPTQMLKSYMVDLKAAGQLVMPDESVTVTLVSLDANVDLDDGLPVLIVAPLVKVYDVLVRDA